MHEFKHRISVQELGEILNTPEKYYLLGRTKKQNLSVDSSIERLVSNSGNLRRYWNSFGSDIFRDVRKRYEVNMKLSTLIEKFHPRTGTYRTGSIVLSELQALDHTSEYGSLSCVHYLLEVATSEAVQLGS